jgi:hypothetical protein
MAHWTFWEWTAYGALFIASAIVAADTGFRLAPTLMEKLPAFFHSAWWGFAPLALLLIATVILLARDFGVIGRAPLSADANILKWRDEPPKKVVADKRFINERVVLDGTAYRNCRFENVTFVFNGTAPFELTRNTISGRIQVTSDNPVVLGTMGWLKGIGMIPAGVEMTAPPGVVIESPQRMPGPPPR